MRVRSWGLKWKWSAVRRYIRIGGVRNKFERSLGIGSLLHDGRDDLLVMVGGVIVLGLLCCVNATPLDHDLARTSPLQFPRTEGAGLGSRRHVARGKPQGP